MADQQQNTEPEAVAQSFRQPEQQRKTQRDPMLSASTSNKTRSGQSQVPPERISTASDATSSTHTSRHRDDYSPNPTKVPAKVKNDVARTKHTGASSTGSSVFAAVTRAFGLGQDSEQGKSADEDALLRTVARLRKENTRMQRKLDNYREEALQLDHDNEGLKQNMHQMQQESENSNRQYEEAIMSLRTELKQSNSREATLQRQVVKDKEKLSAAYTAAVSTFARDVSRDLPDDIVKSSISTFLHGDFFSWCADMCAPQIAEQDATVQHLRSIGIINSGERYLKAPTHLQFTANLDESSPLVLLQAALARALCDAFLKSPFFLARQQQALEAFLKDLSVEDQTAAVDWRIQTVACLEVVAPYDPTTSVRLARQFEDSFRPLLKELDEESRDDLAGLFTDFALLALKLWKIRTNIAVYGMRELADKVFDLGSKYMDGEPTTVSALGQRLNGHPIGVVVRPLIISQPVVPDDRQPYEIVWSKALVWVSPHP